MTDDVEDLAERLVAGSEWLDAEGQDDFAADVREAASAIARLALELEEARELLQAANHASDGYGRARDEYARSNAANKAQVAALRGALEEAGRVADSEGILHDQWARTATKHKCLILRVAKALGMSPHWSEAEIIDGIEARAQAVEAEAAALRGALGEIARGLVPPDRHGHYLAHREAVRIARAALNQQASPSQASVGRPDGDIPGAPDALEQG